MTVHLRLLKHPVPFLQDSFLFPGLWTVLHLQWSRVAALEELEQSQEAGASFAKGMRDYTCLGTGTEGAENEAVNQWWYFLNNLGRDFWKDSIFSLADGASITVWRIHTSIYHLKFRYPCVFNSHLRCCGLIMSAMVRVSSENLKGVKCRLRFTKAGFKSCLTHKALLKCQRAHVPAT